MTYPEGRKERSFRPFSSLGICARKAACVRENLPAKICGREGPLGSKTKDLGKESGKSAERGREAERGAGRRVGAGADGLCPLALRSEFFEAENGGESVPEGAENIPG